MTATTGKKRFRINNSLISLKFVVFFAFLGFAALHCFNSLYHKALGLNFDEYRIINIVTPLVSALGPLFAGPLADKLASRNATTYGRSLRLLIVICLILTSIFYACMLAIPPVERFEARRPLVSFGCDSSGAVIFQERCTESKTCHHWSKEKVGSLILTNCSYTCQKPSQYEFLYSPWTKGSPPSPTDVSSDSEWERDYDDSGSHTTESMMYKRHVQESEEVFSEEDREKREIGRVYVNPPHLCVKKKLGDGSERVEKCHVYTEDTESLTVHATLGSATNKENDTHSADWCNYPLDGFQCDIPEKQIEFMSALKNDRCKPMMECEVIDPYESPDSVLAATLCITTIGDIDVTYWGYFALRLIGEIFPLAALTLLNTAIVIATRETSTGRGELCRQYVWGSIAWIILLSTLNILHLEGDVDVDEESPWSFSHHCITLVIVAVICFVLASIILIFSSNMPLSPPEWWWHTKTGMLVYPMSAIRKYSPETIILTIITMILGLFFGSIHSYFFWVHTDFNGVNLLALLLVFLMFFNVDKFIEYCGHSNILISTFTYYIIRFTAITILDDCKWLAIIMEIFEPLAIGVSWITIILYMRHIIPRRLTATGQALAVIAHFCLGKCFGALVGLVMNSRDLEASTCMYQGLAIAACIIALVYFILYNLILAPRCAAKAQSPPPLTNLSSQPQQNGSAANGTNGNYTPLRVYHNERGKKGQFRY